MNQIKLSEVFELAANKYLYEGYASMDDDGEDTWDKSVYSCDAIFRALGDFYDDYVVKWGLPSVLKYPVIDYIEAFAPNLQNGLCGTFRAFNDVKDDLVQEYRYSWLMFLAMVAEEEGAVLEYSKSSGVLEARLVYIKE